MGWGLARTGWGASPLEGPPDGGRFGGRGVLDPRYGFVTAHSEQWLNSKTRRRVVRARGWVEASGFLPPRVGWA